MCMVITITEISTEGSTLEGHREGNPGSLAHVLQMYHYRPSKQCKPRKVITDNAQIKYMWRYFLRILKTVLIKTYVDSVIIDIRTSLTIRVYITLFSVSI